jgi:glyoxylase-like metal-dependent hydrolase (beta-lactamase superfamily II)
MITEISPGIFTAEHRVVEGKNGIVLGAKRALAIDCGTYPEEGRAIAEFIRSQGYEPNRLVLTHGHGDHLLGGEAFLGAEVFATGKTATAILRQLGGWAERSGEPAQQMRGRLPFPTVLFSDELRIDLGERTVLLFTTPGHSSDSICALVEEPRILFAADTVVTGIVPAIGDGDGRELEASLQRLSTMEIEVLVAGHGPTLHGPERVRAWLKWLSEYLAGIRAFVGERLARGDDPEAIADAATYDRFVGDRLPREKHGMERRHRDTVVKIVAEEMGG